MGAFTADKLGTVQYNAFQEEVLRAVYARNARRGVLFYCKQGANRSGLIGVLYAALCLNADINSAYEAVQALRPIVYLGHRWQSEATLLEVAWQLEPQVKRLAVGLGSGRALETLTVEADEWHDIVAEEVRRAKRGRAEAWLTVSDRGHGASATVSDRGDRARATRTRERVQDPIQ